MSGKRLCTRCKQPLVEERCFICGGEGQVRKWLFLKEECSACNGSGISLRCPDELNHLFGDWRRKTPGKYVITQRRTVIPSFKKKPLLKPYNPLIEPTISKLVPKHRLPPPQWWKQHRYIPPWDPMYPNPWHPNHPRNPNRFRRRPFGQA